MWLITGQSNALSKQRDGYADPDNQSPTITTYNEVLLTATGDDFENPAFVGQWPIRLAAIRGGNVTIINGAVGGKSIVYFLPDGLNYTETVSRVELSGQSVDRIFWLQGETDAAAGMTTSDYAGYLQRIIYDWQNDYPNAEIVIGLINYGCNATTSQVDDIRKAQTLIATRFGFKTFDTAGITHYDDDCHYTYDGYAEIAERVSNVIDEPYYFFLPMCLWGINEPIPH